MSESEKKAFAALVAVCWVVLLAVGFGLSRLGASSEVAAAAFAVLIGLEALGSAWAFARYSTPPERH